MKKFSLKNFKARPRWVLPSTALVIGILAAFGSHATTSDSKATDGSKSSKSQIEMKVLSDKTISPKVTIDGIDIPTAYKGSRDVVTPNGKTHLEVSNRNIKITTAKTDQERNIPSKSSGSVEINITTQSVGGEKRGTTQFFNYTSNSKNTTTSSNTTSIVRHGTTEVIIDR